VSGKELVVVIDAGHGGNDPGNLHFEAGMLDEEHINLNIAMKLGEYIQTYTDNVKVIYTRTTDKDVSLSDRVKVANNNNADYFISVHCNMSTSRFVNGSETHIHNNNARVSRLLASSIEKDFKTRAKRNSRGVKTKDDRTHNLQVLWQTTMPGVLVECGFMSNPSEEQFLNTERGVALMASSIFRGFRDFAMKRHPGVIVKVEPGDAASTPANSVDSVPALASSETVYRVQVLASPTLVGADAIEFRKLKDYQVEMVEATDGRKFKYRYFVGKVATKKEARQLQKLVHDAGIADAFVVEFNP